MICLLDNEQHVPQHVLSDKAMDALMKSIMNTMHCDHHWVKHKTGEVTCDKCGCYKEILP